MGVIEHRSVFASLYAAVRATASGSVRVTRVGLLGLAWFCSGIVNSAVLPLDSVDVLYHRYDGGGMEIDGPSVLVRKSVGTALSVSGNYYVDTVSAASVDVLATASPYSEERTEYTAAADYLHDKTLMSLAYTNSDENDFQSDTVSFSVSHGLFGDLTTLTLGFARGWDTVGRVNSDFSEEVDRRNYRIGVTQILTRDSLLSLNFETITDEGFLNNPYRRVRYLDPNDLQDGYSWEAERYPATRTSNAIALRGMHYVPWRGAINVGYRYFEDTWDIEGHTFELGYVHPVGETWIGELGYRFYTQDKAAFYADLFPYRNSQTFLARDKELSTFSSHGVTLGVTWNMGSDRLPGVEKAAFTLLADYIFFQYDDYRDVTSRAEQAGEEPLYDFGALVTRLLMTFNY